MQYQISVPIYVRYVAINRNTGLTDLYIIPTNPSGVDQTHVLMAHLENGLYSAAFTPNATGWWQVRVHSATSAVEVYSARYYVGTISDANPAQEDGNLGTIKTALETINSLVPTKFDNIILTYNGDNTLATAVYKLGVATVSTITLSYTNGLLVSVVKT